MSLLRLLLRGTPQDRVSQALPVLAYAVVTALALTVAGGAEFFFTLGATPGREQDGLFYASLASVACALLAVPMLSLSTSAVRLSTRRRDGRLASLRLVGAPRRLLHRLALVESTLVALVGAALGVLGHLAVAPLFGMLHFAGTRLGTAQIIPPLWLGGAVVLVVVGTAAGAAALGLRRVAITPLGVRTRQDAPPTRWLQALVGAGTVLVLVVVGQQLPQLVGGLVMTVVVVVGMLACGMAVLALIGPPVLALGARRTARRATGPRAVERLLAARTLLEDPRAVWRQVQGVALVSFVSVVVGVALALSGGDGGGSDAVLMADMRTGVLVTIGLSYLTLAAAATVHAAAEVFDRRDLYLALDRLGMPRATIERARTRTVAGPVVTVTVLGALAGGLLTFPLAGVALVVDPTTVLTVLVALVVGVLTVRGGVLLTRRLLSDVLREAQPVV